MASRYGESGGGRYDEGRQRHPGGSERYRGGGGGGARGGGTRYDERAYGRQGDSSSSSRHRRSVSPPAATRGGDRYDARHRDDDRDRRYDRGAENRYARRAPRDYRDDYRRDGPPPPRDAAPPPPPRRDDDARHFGRYDDRSSSSNRHREQRSSPPSNTERTKRAENDPRAEAEGTRDVGGVEGAIGDGEEEEDAEQAMMKAMGFGGFGTTKGSKVEGNQTGFAEVRKERTWRQYMQRKGGFNRPLSPTRD